MIMLIKIITIVDILVLLWFLLMVVNLIKQQIVNNLRHKKNWDNNKF